MNFVLKIVSEFSCIKVNTLAGGTTLEFYFKPVRMQYMFHFSLAFWAGYILPAFDRHNRHLADVRGKSLVLNVIAEQSGREMCKHAC